MIPHLWPLYSAAAHGAYMYVLATLVSRFANYVKVKSEEMLREISADQLQSHSTKNSVVIWYSEEPERDDITVKCAIDLCQATNNNKHQMEEFHIRMK